MSSFFNDERELIKLEVVITSKYPDQEKYSDNMLYHGDSVYVPVSFSESNFNKAVFSINGVEFIRVPHEQIFLVETANEKCASC